MEKYRRAHSQHVRKAQSVGKKTRPQYAIKTDINGHEDVYISDIIQSYELVQQHAEGCKIENIIKRAQLGDQRALNQKQPVYGDFTAMPTSLIETHNLAMRAEELFYKQPVEIRAAYNHSPVEFFADWGSEKMLGLLKVEKPAQEVKKSE